MTMGPFSGRFNEFPGQRSSIVWECPDENVNNLKRPLSTDVLITVTPQTMTMKPLDAARKN